MADNISRLNDDCLLHIFQFLPIVDKIKVERVCHGWRELSLKSWSTFRKFDLARITWGFPESDKFTYVDARILNHVLERCGRFLIKIDISKPFNKDGRITRKDANKLHIIGATSDVLKIIASNCPEVKTIFISDPCVNLHGLRSLITRCTKIAKLCLFSRKWNWDEDELGDIFATMAKLKYFKFSCNNITGKCLQKLPVDLTELHILRMTDSSSIAVSNAINRLCKLKALTIDSYPTINVELLQAIGNRNENLQVLRLTGCVCLDNIKNEKIKEISRFENLRILDFQHNNNVTDKTLQFLAFHCQRLQYINISYCYEISEKGIAHLATKPRLEHLIANDLPRVTGKNYEKFLHLKTLECRHCQRLKVESLCNLVRTSMNLEILDVSQNKFNVYELIDIANTATITRTQVILKLYIGHENYFDTILISSPFLNVIESSSDGIYREIFDSLRI